MEELRLAIEDAQGKAMTMSGRLNTRVKVVTIHMIEQRANNKIPIQTMSFTTASTPIEAGENKVTAVVEAVFLYSE